jgi:aryl-alcohol dehydrogenase-like predicted oxidoreductase
MEQRTLGQSGVAVSVLGLGTWPMGGEWWGGTDDEESIRTIHRAQELGVTLFDTAEAYGAGHAEEVLGRALAGRRERAIIADKVVPNHFEPQQIRDAFDASCQRLQTDYIDVYFLHWPNIDVPIGVPMETLESLRAEGRIRAIGVSNFTSAELDAANQHGRVDVLQPPYNMFWRFVEGDQLPYCQEHGIGVMAYSGLAQGLLTGTLSARTTFPPGDNRPTTVLFQPGTYERCLDAVEALRPIAERAGLTLAQLAIAWLLARPGISTALNGARTVAEIEENVPGATVDVRPEDLAEADRITREVFDTLPRVPDMFQNWERWELQRRRYEQTGQLPEPAPAES